MEKPSVTTLLGLLDKPALLKWANQQGLIGVDISKKKKEWLDYGTSLHSQIENYIRTGEQFDNPIHQALFKRFMEDKTILGYEKKIETEWFTGIYDISYKLDNKIYLADFKSNKKKIYLENKLQLVAYSMAEPCDSFAIISIPEFCVMNFKIEDREPYIEILKSLSNIYKNKQIIEQR